MLREMPYHDFLAWQAFDSISPIGDRRADWQAASICSAVFNSMAIRAGAQKRFRTGDFLLEFTDEEGKEAPKVEAPSTNWKVMKTYARMFAKQANADAEKKRTRNGRRR